MSIEFPIQSLGMPCWKRVSDHFSLNKIIITKVD